MRKLVSIQKIIDIKPIEGADFIEQAKILGWSVVVKKGEFSVGDLVVYAEIDSLFPDKPEFEFLKGNDGKIKRIRTQKMRGIVSQGIAFPMTILNGIDFVQVIDGKYFYVNKELSETEQYVEIIEDYDVTEIIGVEKYEPVLPACLGGQAKGNFPSFIPKTDEDRVQVMKKIINKYQGRLFVETEKLDGSSATFYIRDGEFGVCSRNLELKEEEKDKYDNEQYNLISNSFWKVARQQGIEEKMRSLGKNIAFQGELVGEGIQGNKYNIKGHDVYIFRVFDIDTYKFLPYLEGVEIVKKLGLKFVPIISTDYVLENDVDALVARATKKSILNPKVWQEGTVFVLADPQNDKEDRVSFKAISPQFLLKYDDA